MKEYLTVQRKRKYDLQDSLDSGRAMLCLGTYVLVVRAGPAMGKLTEPPLAAFHKCLPHDSDQSSKPK